MNHYFNSRKEEKLRNIQAKQRQYGLVASRDSITGDGAPIISSDSLGILMDYNRYSSTVQGRNSWGRFEYDYRCGCFYLINGEVPDHLKDQPPLIGGKAEVYKDYTRIITEKGNLFEIDYESSGQTTDYEMNKITEHLYDLGMSIWIYEIEVKEEATQKHYLANDSAMLPVTFAIADKRRRQLVAAELVIGGKDQTLVKALKASIAKLSRNTYGSTDLRILEKSGGGVYLNSSGMGFVSISSNFTSKGAIGFVTLLLNPLTLNPDDARTHYYILSKKDQDYEAMFIERFQIASIWAVQPSWATYLISKGSAEKLIDRLDIFGDSPYTIGLAVVKEDDRWKKIIEQGLAENKIKIEG